MKMIYEEVTRFLKNVYAVELDDDCTFVFGFDKAEEIYKERKNLIGEDYVCGDDLLYHEFASLCRVEVCDSGELRPYSESPIRKATPGVSIIYESEWDKGDDE